MRNYYQVLRAFLVCALWAVSILPASAQGVGAIGGTVTDTSEGVMPGVTVTLSASEGTVGSNQQAVTDTRGAYQFMRLVPGAYIVRAELQGFRPTEQRNIIVTADVTSRADLKLAVGAMEEGVTVTGEAPLLDTTSALKQTSLSQATLQVLPNRVDLWSIARAIPNITVAKLDVGGLESGRRSIASVNGTSSEGGFYIDGTNVTGVSDAGDAPIMYLLPWMFSEVNYQAGNGPAESARGGLVFNMITRTGTNQVHGGLSLSGTMDALNSDNRSPELIEALLRQIPARVRAANPNLEPRYNVKHFYDSGAWLSGPIIRDRLWFSATEYRQGLSQESLGTFSSDGTPVPDEAIMWNLLHKVAWQATKSSQLSYVHVIQRKDDGFFGATSSVSSSIIESGARTHNIKTPQINQVKLTWTPSNRMVVDATVSTVRANDWYGPPDDVAADAIAGSDLVTNTSLRVSPTFRITDTQRYTTNGSVSYFTTAHDIKAGYQLEYIERGNLNYSTSNMRAVYRDGVPDSVNTYNTPNTQVLNSLEPSLFIQDKWRPFAKLTLNVGVRYDAMTASEDATCQAATVFVAAACFPAQKRNPDFKDVSPRFSAVYDLAGDGRTALKFSANRYVVPVGVTVVGRLSSGGVVSDSRSWTSCAAGQSAGCDLNGDRLPQVTELGPSNGFAFANNNRYADGYRRPWANEYSIELQRELPGNVVLTVGFTRRERRGDIGSRNMAVPTSSYIPLTVTEVNSGRTVTVYNQAPALRGRVDLLWNNDSELDANYNGGRIVVDKRMSRRWMMTGGVGIEKSVGYVGLSDLNNPNSKEFSRGILGNDVPYNLKLSSTYELPYGLLASGTIQNQKGFPENTTVSVGNNTVSLTQGTQSILVAARGTTRLPSSTMIDLSFQRRFRILTKTLSPRLDIYNLSNIATISGWNSTVGSSYHVVTSTARPRMVKLGLTADF